MSLPKKLVLLVLCWLIPQVNGFSGVRPLFATYTFGMNLMTGLNNELFTLFIVKEFEGQIISSTPITRGQFMQQAQGAMDCKANPTGQNLFLKYEVASCLPPEEYRDGFPVIPDCGIFDEIWKLRFWEYPYKLASGQQPGKGWAENPTTPSARQMLLLSDYGIYELHSVACGEELFRLLKDIGDPDWVDNYRKGY
ncbi:MAG: hypothetical protein IT226_16400 [Flavobacteriales bacterium]|nr:hypothetical protein [Flavobacteriales bacterium]